MTHPDIHDTGHSAAQSTDTARDSRDMSYVDLVEQERGMKAVSESFIESRNNEYSRTTGSVYRHSVISVTIPYPQLVGLTDTV